MKKIACIHLKEDFRKWGIERTEEKIKESYPAGSRERRILLECYHEIVSKKS